MTEREIQKSVFAEWRKRGAPRSKMWAVPNGPESRRVPGFCPGAHDVHALHGGEFFTLELKTEIGKPSVEQLEFRDAINGAGGYAFVANGLPAALACLEAWGVLRREAA